MSGRDALTIEAARVALGRRDAILGSKRRAVGDLARAVEELEASAAAGRCEVVALAEEIAAAEESTARDAYRGVARAVLRWADGQKPVTPTERALVERLIDWGKRDERAAHR